MPTIADEFDWSRRREVLAASIDPRISFVSPGGPDDLDCELIASNRKGSCEVARLYRFEFDENDEFMLWGSRVRYWLDLALEPHAAPEIVDSLVTAALSHVVARSEDHPDRTMLIRWPSRDVNVEQALVRAGFQPTLKLARLNVGPSASTAVVRLAGQAEAAVISDLEHLCQLIYDLHRLETGLGVFRLPSLALRHLEALTSRAIQDGRMIVWRSGRKRILGCAAVTPELRGSWLAGAFVDHPVASLSDFFVLPSMRRKGIATSLLSAAIEHAGDDRALLAVHSTVNTGAKGFWSRAGFEPIWTTWRLSL